MSKISKFKMATILLCEKYKFSYIHPHMTSALRAPPPPPVGCIMTKILTDVLLGYIMI